MVMMIYDMTLQHQAGAVASVLDTACGYAALSGIVSGALEPDHVSVWFSRHQGGS